MCAGLKNSSGDYVAIMDADMQATPSLLYEMVKIIEKGEYDCITRKHIK